MFAQRLNEIRATLLVAPVGPLLVKEGRHQPDGDRSDRSFHPAATRNPPRPRLREGRDYGDYDSDNHCFDMAFVWTRTASGPHYYLPGSSLRGVLRVAAERVVARWRPEWARASDPFRCASGRWVDQQRQLESKPRPTGADIYAMAGPIERCFGHTALRGRLTVADAYLVHERDAAPIVRDGVGINRSTGAAAENIKFQFEAITGGVFKTTLVLVNYECWQLGLLAHMLAALDDGVVRIGYGTYRGLGRVRVAVDELRWRWYVAPASLDTGVVPSLASLAGLAGIDRPEHYNWRDNTAQPLQLPTQIFQSTKVPLGREWVMRPPRKEALETGFAPTDWDTEPWTALAATLPGVLSAWRLPEELREVLLKWEEQA
jgi:CRISPR/Cas system CSM-associated protein Csm3 (group 7 of RAMP superfamily)